MPSRTTTTVAKKQASTSPYQLDTDQVSRASTALLRKLQEDEKSPASNGVKANLLEDADVEDASDSKPVWLVLTTKKHIVDKKRLKPGKITLPHPYTKSSTGESLRVCLITADPQRKYKDLVSNPAFPLDTAKLITRVIGLEKLKSKYNSFESKRQLLGEYDVFLADDRVITYLPTVLGKVFYKSSAKRPIPVSLEGRRQNFDEQGNKRRKLTEGGTKVSKSEVKPAEAAAEIEKALASALVHLAPSTTTAVKVGTASMSAKEVQQNIEAVVSGLIETYVPSKWRNVRSVHIKGANTIALPIWLTDELWEDAHDVKEQAPAAYSVAGKKRKAKLLNEDQPDTIEIPGADGKMRKVSKPSKKAKTQPADQENDAGSRTARKDSIKKQKAALTAPKEAFQEAVVEKVVKPIKKRMKAADLI